MICVPYFLIISKSIEAMNSIYSDELIILRKYKKEDLYDRFTAIKENLDKISRWLSFCRPDYSEQQNLLWYVAYPKNWKRGIEFPFAIVEKSTGKYIGECVLNHINYKHKVANITYWIKKEFSGKGIATKAVNLIAQFGFNELGLRRLEIFMEPENIASIKVAEKAGAQKEGLLRNRVYSEDQSKDALLYSLIPTDLK